MNEPIPFSYDRLEPPAQAIAREAADKIRKHGQLAAENIVAIGAELAKVKKALGHGHYLAWLEAEFTWSERQAQRFVNVYEHFGNSDTVSDLGPIDFSALYLLAAPSTPELVREAAREKAAAGERVTRADVQELISQQESIIPASSQQEAEEEEQGEGNPGSKTDGSEAPFNWGQDFLELLEVATEVATFRARTIVPQIANRRWLVKRLRTLSRCYGELADEIDELDRMP